MLTVDRFSTTFSANETVRKVIQALPVGASLTHRNSTRAELLMSEREIPNDGNGREVVTCLGKTSRLKLYRREVAMKVRSFYESERTVQGIGARKTTMDYVLFDRKASTTVIIVPIVRQNTVVFLALGIKGNPWAINQQNPADIIIGDIAATVLTCSDEASAYIRSDSELFDCMRKDFFRLTKGNSTYAQSPFFVDPGTRQSATAQWRHVSGVGQAVMINNLLESGYVAAKALGFVHAVQ